MGELVVNTFLRLIKPLRMEIKLSLLSRLSAHVQEAFVQEHEPSAKLLDQLAGSWADLPDDLSDTIMQDRTISDKTL